MTNPTRWGFSIFCEDIREEVGEKFSWMGIFRKEITVPEDFPVFIKNFAIIIKYYEIVDLYKNDLIFRIYGTDDVVIAEQKIMRDSIVSWSLEPGSVAPDENLIGFELPFIFSPMVVSKAGSLKVRVYDGVEEVKLGSIRVRAVAPPA